MKLIDPRGLDISDVQSVVRQRIDSHAGAVETLQAQVDILIDIVVVLAAAAAPRMNDEQLSEIVGYGWHRG